MAIVLMKVGFCSFLNRNKSVGESASDLLK